MKDGQIRDYDFIVAQLVSDDVRDRCTMLQILSGDPTGHLIIRRYVEDLTHDTSPCLISIPFAFGEVRWAAAQALAAERKKANITDAVSLSSVAAPLDVNSLARLVRRAGIVVPRTNDPIANSIAEFGALLRTGELPLYDIEVGERHGCIGIQTWRQINPEITIPEEFTPDVSVSGAELVAV